jgi:transcriptional regulator with XRE-family HTH domain
MYYNITDCIKYPYTLLTTFDFMIIHIGNKIKSTVTKKGISVSEFGRRINMSRENVYSIFKRKSIDTELLSRISKVLEYDFFQYYTPIAAELKKVREENNTLKEMVRFLQTKKKQNLTS